MRPPRWSAISESGFEWEREALDFLREHLPDHEPYRAWSNLEFIDDEGRVNEVDALVLTPTGLILVEIKSRPGTLQGDPHTWTWTTDGRQISDDNPLLLANRKAKRLASVLRRQDTFGRGKVRIPWVEAAIFLSGVRAEPRLDPGSVQRVFRRGDPRSASDRGIIAALTGTSGAELGRRGSVDSNVARATQRAVEQAGIRPRLRSRRVGDYELGAPLAEGGGWQDFLSKHVSLGVARRVRVYPFARAASPEERKRLGRMAAREFRVLEGIDHPGILRVLHFEESELGPALVFEHDPAAMRLDQFLAQHLKDLTLEARLDLLRQLAVGLGYAHGKRLYHQGLTPQNVLVRDLTSDRPRVQIMNWQVAARGEGSTNAVLMMTVGSRDLDDHFADPAKVYLAPESLRARTESGPRADVFSLGAIAYHLFTGKPPADNPLDLPEKLRAGDGLRLSEAIDGVGAGLEDLIRMSTAPNVAQRIGSAPEFLEYMALAEADNRPEPPAPATVDPSVAQRDDRLDGGLIVERRLGRGSTADALLVRREKDGQRLVLKVAIDEVHGDHLCAETELLASLHHHQNIVQFVDTITVSGRVGMLMEWAGEETLASLIRSPTPLSLDLVRRYGDELLQAVDYLEQQGVAHRDIKPENIGVGAVGGTGRKRLVLFDFSLGHTPPENIQAGTQPYLDPFLPLRRPPRWDLHAERYAAAVTLNEMLTGAPPVWGDGLSDPAATEDEARIGSERFEPSLRDGLVAFFRRALSRAPEERFGNAEDMLRAWRQAFAPLDQRPIGQDDLEVIARQLDRRSPIAELGFSVEARDVLLRMHIHTVQQLLAVDRIRFRYLRNVGDKIRREIRLRAKHLAEYRPDLQADGEDTLVPGRASLDRLGELLLPRRPAGDETSEDRALANYLGIESASVWPTPGDVAKACEIPRSVVATALEQARDRWHRARELNEFRTDVLALLQGAGGVATVDELAGQLLAARGSVEEDESDRVRLARAALRAAVELEASVEPIRFGANAEAEPVLLAIHPDLADHARRLGVAADRLAASDPLPSLSRAQQQLAAVPASTAVVPPTAQRLLRLAVAASHTAALSARLEVYPRGMAPLAALRLSLGSFVGARRLTEAEVRERVRGRFPDAAPLPERPGLDALLEEAGAERNWHVDEQGGAYYARDYPTASSTSSLMRHGTLAPAVEATPEVLNARDLEEKLVHAAKTGAFLALTVEPRRAAQAEAELLRRFPRQRVSVERLLLQALREEAATRNAKWSVVIAADAAQPGDSLRAAFGVRGVDPRLRGQEWLADLLLDRAPAGGYQPAPGGMLDLDTAWRAVMEQSLGLQDARTDAAALLWWTLGEGNVERFAALAEAARARIGERLAQEGGPAAEIVVAAIVASRGIDALALGLACTVVFAGGAMDDTLRDAAVRIEPIIGGRRVTPEAGVALAEAARRVANRLEPFGPMARAQHGCAAALLAELRATEHAGRSPALAAGLEARLQAASEALAQAATSGSSVELSRAAMLVRSAAGHDRAVDQPQRIERLAMAARLCRWLATCRNASADFVSAARVYAEDGGFADWARQALRAGDPLPDVAAAYGRLREMAVARREEENRSFGSLLKDWNAAGSGGDGILPIERVLDAVVGRLAAETPLLLLVLDGLSFAVHRALVAEFVRQGWIELAPRGSAAMPPVIAALPTVTEVSRASLLSGTLARGTASFERAGFAAHPCVRQESRAGKPPLLFHKADVGAGPELEEAVRRAITDRGQQVVGVVHNAVDAQLGGSDQLELVWSADSLRQVAALLRLARDAGRVVVVTGDHGHVLDDGTTQAAAAGGDRWRSTGAVRDGEVDMRGGRVRAEAGGQAVVMAWSERIRYGAKRNGYHGGASPQEVVVPIAVLSASELPRERVPSAHGALRDWVEAPPAEPPWWRDDELPLAAVGVAAPQLPPESRRQVARQPDLFSVPPPEPTRIGWVNRFFTSPTYEAQRRLAGRGAPGDDSLRVMLLALEAHGGRSSRATLAQALGVSALRAGSIVSAARRILNVDQAQVLSLDAVGDEIVLDGRLLRVQFELGEQP